MKPWRLYFKSKNYHLDEILDVTNCNAPPIEVERLARYIGIQTVVMESRPASLTESDGTAIITTPYQYRDLRGAYSIAHHMGHILLDPIGFHVCSKKSAHEEAAADDFAANLMTPKPMLDTVVGNYRVSALASLFCVDIPYIQKRINALYGNGSKL